MTDTEHIPPRVPACRLCRSSRLPLLIEVEGHQIRHCPRCGLGQTVDHGLGGSYDRAYLTSGWHGVEPSPQELERSVRSQLRRIRVVRRAAPGRQLLEVGFGPGCFLEAARRAGFQVRGIDVSSAAAEFCTRHFGLPVQVASVEDAHFCAGSLDAIAAWHVLEHVTDPLATLRKMREWLAPRGIIAVEVPNYESHDARCLGADWFGWQPRYHRWHCTPRALVRMLNEAKYSVERVWHRPSALAREQLKRIPVLGLFRRLLSRFYVGTSLFAIARSRPAD